jgi:hypothetical protein
MSRRYSKDKNLAFLFLIALGWLVTPFMAIWDIWNARRYKSRLKAVLISLIFWIGILIYSVLTFKKLRNPEYGHLLLFVTIPWVWVIIFRPVINGIAPIFSGDEFYSSRAWLDLRYRALRDMGRQCMLCGATEGEMHVDHIKPRSKFPDLALDYSNLQILCRECNFGKSNIHRDDFRD